MTDGLQVIGWREVVGNRDLPTDLAHEAKLDRAS